MRNERGTSYTAEIETPSGLTFHASVYVPPDAEYAAMNEQAEVVELGVSHMLAVHLASDNARAETAARDLETSGDDEGWSRTVGACFVSFGAHVCVLDHGHPGAHRAENGMQWFTRDPNAPGGQLVF